MVFHKRPLYFHKVGVRSAYTLASPSLDCTCGITMGMCCFSCVTRYTSVKFFMLDFPGASLQRQGNYREAIKYHSLVLELSARHGEDSGSTEAYGAIADCYTELGDLEQAAKYYDQYIARLETD